MPWLLSYWGIKPVPEPCGTDYADIYAEQVDELELTKAKATELLKAHDGDAVKAMRAYVTPE